MTEPTPLEVIQLVRGAQLMCRTAILLLGKQHLGYEVRLAAKYNLDPLNYAEWRLQKVVPGQRYLALNKESLLQDIDEICYVNTTTNALLVYNLDVALAYLPHPDRSYVWDFLRDRFRKRPRALVIAMPAEAEHLLPNESSMGIWHKAGRICKLK